VGSKTRSAGWKPDSYGAPLFVECSRTEVRSEGVEPVKARLLPVVLLVVTIAAGITGCGGGAPEEGPSLTPVVEPPVIAEEGVLRVGVDMAYPPFAATVDGATVGIDVDVAAAVAERLGLRLELVDVKRADMTAALDSGEIDVMLGAVPIADAVLANVTTAGSYIVDGPAFFARSSGETSASVVATVTPEQLPAMRVGAQASSEAFWELENEYGEGFVQSFDTLKDAIVALEAGELDVVAGDAVVGAYIARDIPVWASRAVRRGAAAGRLGAQGRRGARGGRAHRTRWDGCRRRARDHSPQVARRRACPDRLRGRRHQLISAQIAYSWSGPACRSDLAAYSRCVCGYSDLYSRSYPAVRYTYAPVM